MAKKLEIENRTRAIHIYERMVPGPPDPNGKVRMVHVHDEDVVIGDVANTPELLASHGASYSRRCPAPVVIVDAGWPSTLTPAQRANYDALVKRGDLRVREITA